MWKSKPMTLILGAQPVDILRNFLGHSGIQYPIKSYVGFQVHY